MTFPEFKKGGLKIMNSKNIYVEFTFINKKGIKKTVHFPMDKQSYDAYHDPSVPEEWTNRMMLEEYREYCAEQNYRKKVMPWPVDNHGNEIEFPCEEPTIEERMEEQEERKEKMSIIERILSLMPLKQRIAFALVELEGLSQRQAAKEMKINEASFSKLYRRAKKRFEQILSSKNF